MGRLISFILFVVCIFVSSVRAHPVRKIEMEYDHSQKMLHISVPHITSHVREDYIRKLVVDKNGEEVETKRYAMQNDPQALEEGIKVEAVEGDKLTVKVLVSEGGSYEETFLVPSPVASEEDEKKTDQPAAAENSNMQPKEQKERGY